jgi:hypothetical protein
VSDQLIQALQNPKLYDHDVESFQVLETHISWVILTGPFAYKIKKPFNFGFLDFSTLEKRKHFCEEEIRLNQRLAPSLYLSVLEISGTEQAPQLNSADNAIEYAIKMVQFPQDNLLDHLLKRDQLTADHIDGIAETVAQFHSEAQVAETDSEFGLPEQVMAPIEQNFEQILPFLKDQNDLRQLKQLKGWAKDSFTLLKPVLSQRKARGKIRECHGDLHLGNITLIDGVITLFDCIEFNESFRWIDLISEVAFFAMDLEDRGLHAYANRFINAYLEHTDDYEGLKVLNFYKSYRALVRAKVALFNLHQPEISEGKRAEIFAQYRSYTALAERYMAIPNEYILLMHGYSGTGKTTVSTELVEQLGAIRLRSDVVRKRLFSDQQNSGLINEGIYSYEASEQTFAHTVQLARTILQAGFPAIIDATFLQARYREMFHTLAEEQAVALQIIDCTLDDKIVKQRIAQRSAMAKDASDATIDIYLAQKDSAEPLSAEEMSHTLTIDTKKPETIKTFAEQLKQRIS